MSVELRLLEAFVAVVDEGTFTAAAARLTLSQPALSRRIVQLERLVGGPVLQRTTRATDLTAAGEALLPHARAALRSAEAGALAARAVAGGGRTLRVLLSRHGDGRVVGLAMARLREQQPRVRVDVARGSSREAIDALRHGRVDVAFARALPEGDLDGLDAELVLREALLAVLPASHPLAALDVVPLARFAAEPAVFFNSDDLCSRRTVREVWGQDATVPDVAVALRPDVDAMVDEVAIRGDAVTIAYPADEARAASLGLVLRPLAPEVDRPLYLLQRSDDERRQVTAFVALVRTTAGPRR
ncbi:LysR family transcriptional regulator [Patulibacter defluvii]|uniref:LysR family transcriptional regulator n=1 Tax=Patulibacter defluvii TaxID=3095358 RepID=UPI002A7571CF|nr:LysR substrate-binding domain-containing protein [Patulibacter sp. DM4]